MKVVCLLCTIAHALLAVPAYGNESQSRLERDLQARTCASDMECGPGTFCSEGLCRLHGTCGTAFDCINPSNMFMRPRCQGYDTCTAGKCQFDCSMVSSCPNNDAVSCFASPCEVGMCSEPYASCVDNNCGGCTSIYFAPDGSQACAFAEDSVCTSDAECEPGYFCSEEECIPYGYCRSRLDCQNPDNLYLRNITVLCLGYHDCDSDTAQCQFMCGETNCPNNDEETCEPELCNSVGCDEPYEHCFVDNCGGCKPVYISGSGRQVCQDIEPQDPVCDYADCDGMTGLTQIECYFETFFCFLNNL